MTVDDDLEKCRTACESAIRRGDTLVAYDLARRGLALCQTDVRLRQLHALSLARAGDPRRALEPAEALYAEGHQDEETVGILARIHKDLWLEGEEDPGGHLRRSLQLYLDAFERHGGYWTGINAATLACVSGDSAVAARLARDVRSICARALEAQPDSPNTFWLQTTLAECALIEGDHPEASAYYERAAALARQDGGRFGDLRSVRKNARLLLAALRLQRESIEAAIAAPPIVVFTGHMIDRADRATPRFPPTAEDAVREAIERALDRMRPAIAFGSAAAGSDILCAEALLARGAEVHLVLPVRPDYFEPVSVNIGPGWASRFRRVVERAAEVVVASPEAGGPPPDAVYEYTNALILGLAADRAAHLGTEIVGLAVWDGRPGRPGGTGTAVSNWRQQQIPVEVLRPRSPNASERNPPVPDPGTLPDLSWNQEIGTAIFADAVGFCALAEEQIPRFVEHFLGGIAALAARNTPPLTANTWGDGLFFVFPGVEAAGLFALDVCRMTAEANWTARGLPPLSVRMALHSGPMFRQRDPLTGRDNYFGAHVSRGSRIEPITPPGQVYASQAFAALAAAQRIRSFRCEYVGQTPLAKGYGTFPTYHVRPSRKGSASQNP